MTIQTGTFLYQICRPSLTLHQRRCDRKKPDRHNRSSCSSCSVLGMSETGVITRVARSIIAVRVARGYRPTHDRTPDSLGGVKTSTAVFPSRTIAAVQQLQPGEINLEGHCLSFLLSSARRHGLHRGMTVMTLFLLIAIRARVTGSTGRSVISDMRPSTLLASAAEPSTQSSP